MDQVNRKDAIASYKARKIVGGVYCIRNTITGRILLQSACDLHGCENRFRFSQTTDSCTLLCLSADWKQYGGKAFAFELLESLEKKETQTDAEFQSDIETLLMIWQERLAETPMY